MNTVKFHWGHGIFIFMLGFISIALFGLWKSRQYSFPLVKNDYFQDDLHLSDILAKKANSQKIGAFTSIHDDTLFVNMPKEYFLQGEVSLLRPNNLASDTILQLSYLQDAAFVVGISNLERGKWIAKISWVDASSSYLIERSLVL